MKQKIYTLGLVTTSIIIIGALLKTMHWPGGGQLLVLGILTLILVFVPLALRNHYMTAGENKNLLLYIVTLLTCLVVFGGMLFKVMHWPGAGIALLVALPFPYLVFLPVFLAVTSRDRNFSIYNIVAVLCLLAGVSVFSALLALNVSKEQINDSMELSRSYNRLERVLDEIPASAGETAVTVKINDLLKIVDDYQARIFSREGITEKQWQDDPWSYPQPEASDVEGRALVIKDPEPTPDTRLQTGLREMVSDLRGTAASQEIAGAVPLIFDFSETPGDRNGWTMGKFGVSPRVWSLIYLDGLETNLKLLKAGY